MVQSTPYKIFTIVHTDYKRMYRKLKDVVTGRVYYCGMWSRERPMLRYHSGAQRAIDYLHTAKIRAVQLAGQGDKLRGFTKLSREQTAALG